MDVGKFCRWDRNMEWDCASVVVNFLCLAGGTMAGPLGNLRSHTTPDEAGGDETFCGTNARVGHAMEVVENGALKGKWDKWAENFCGGIT
jgi:hypothetical protein